MKKARKNLDWLIEHIEKEQGDGDEVEKEKLYTVEIPDPNEKNYIVYLSKNEIGEACIAGGSCYEEFKNDRWRHNAVNQFTESEIKQDFEWAWQFAKEVTDDTEV